MKLSGRHLRFQVPNVLIDPKPSRPRSRHSKGNEIGALSSTLGNGGFFIGMYNNSFVSEATHPMIDTKTGWS